MYIVNQGLFVFKISSVYTATKNISPNIFPTDIIMLLICANLISKIWTLLICISLFAM